MSYDSFWSMIGCRWHILPMLPLSFSEKEKYSKPKEEIVNLNGFEFMYLTNLKVPYLLYLSSISIKVISMGTTLFPSMVRLALP